MIKLPGVIRSDIDEYNESSPKRRGTGEKVIKLYNQASDTPLAYRGQKEGQKADCRSGQGCIGYPARQAERPT